MPGGLDIHATQSYIAFGVIKYAGYSLSTLYLNHRYPDQPARPFIFGLFRTGLGILLGIIVGFIGLTYLQLALTLFIFGLLPIRLFEWWVTIRTFYRKSSKYPASLKNDLPLGVAYSFVLDAPALFGFLMTGGLWIC